MYQKERYYILFVSPGDLHCFTQEMCHVSCLPFIIPFEFTQ